MARAGYALSTPAPGRVELDPEVLWQALTEVVTRLARRARRRGLRIAAMASSVSGDEAVMLDGEGTPIGPNDLLIAAHALALDLTLVTANVEEFSRVPGLRIENWLVS